MMLRLSFVVISILLRIRLILLLRPLLFLLPLFLGLIILKTHFMLFEPPHDAHTFFHITTDLVSHYSWSSRIDRFLLPLCLYGNPLVTPTVAIPYHSTNLNFKNVSSA